MYGGEERSLCIIASSGQAGKPIKLGQTNRSPKVRSGTKNKTNHILGERQYISNAFFS